jgi:hypothetical protein
MVGRVHILILRAALPVPPKGGHRLLARSFSPKKYSPGVCGSGVQIGFLRQPTVPHPRADRLGHHEPSRQTYPFLPNQEREGHHTPDTATGNTRRPVEALTGRADSRAPR